MAARSATNSAFRKALTCWEPPEGAGEPLACIATTFTFNATFFETECLGRFLQMDSHPAESESVAYLVEREEKLAAARVCVLVDRRHAKDKESLRWDVLGVLVPRAIQHSKVALLVWTNHVRVIIASGNLTEPGYRKNLEVFGTFDLTSDRGDREAVDRTLDFLDEVVEFAVGRADEDTPRARARVTLSSIRQHISGWSPAGARDSGALPLFGTPTQSVISQLGSLWPTATGPAREAYIVSPFFDRDVTETAAVHSFIPLLAKKRPRTIWFDVCAEHRPDGPMRIFAPLTMIQAASQHADVRVRPVLAEQKGEREGEPELRDLHAKMIYLTNGDWIMVMAGSSNFTTAGMGAAENRANLEANVVYRLRASEPDARVLDAMWPEVDKEIDVNSPEIIWDPQSDEDEEGGENVPLPAAFGEAIFIPGQNPALSITLSAPLPARWAIRTPNGPELLSSGGAGTGNHVVPWADEQVPFVLEVTWSTATGTATASWPVNVSDPRALPPPEALRDLTLEELLEILASIRPLPLAVADILRKRFAARTKQGVELDPLKRFDSQAFLLRRTKRVAVALERLRQRLERPAMTRDGFEWRLSGPVGPLSLANAFVRESLLPGEAKFCLAELALALRRVRTERVASSGLPALVVAELLKQTIKSIEQRTADLPATPHLDAYVLAAFKEAMA